MGYSAAVGRRMLIAMLVLKMGYSATREYSAMRGGRMLIAMLVLKMVVWCYQGKHSRRQTAAHQSQPPLLFQFIKV
eukprot:3410324-Rhodomonas_salina.1